MGDFSPSAGDPLAALALPAFSVCVELDSGERLNFPCRPLKQQVLFEGKPEMRYAQQRASEHYAH